MNRTIKSDVIASATQLPIVTSSVQQPVDVTQPTSVQQTIPSWPLHQDQNINHSIQPAISPEFVQPVVPHVQPISVNLLLSGATPINNLPEVSFQTPASTAPIALATELPVQSHSIQSNPYEIQFMPTIRPSATQTSVTESQNDINAATLPLSASPPLSSSCPSLTFNQSNYVLNGPYINPNFSKVINLPVTPSPPPLLEIDENAESSDRMNASPTKRLEHETNEPSIPLSHLITANQYPSLSKIPPAHIAQSFAPMYVSQQQQQQTYQQQQQSSEGEIYSDYVNNPYNLTLQMSQSYNNDDSSEKVVATTITMTTTMQTTATTVSASNMNVFQSVNYFGSANDTAIPPGSEMLFGAP